MVQAKFSLDELQLQFLNDCKAFGFKDKSEMVRAALAHFQAQLQAQALAQSADLYAEVFAHDSDLPHLTELALDSWPA